MSSSTSNFNSITLMLYTCSLLVIFCNAESVARPEKTVTPPQRITDLSSQDESAVGMMTTLEPIDSLDDISRDADDDRCYKFDTCEDCVKSNCSWIVCLNYDFSCSDGPQEMCPELSCSNTTTTTTTTEPPTTTAPSNTTTTTPEPPVTTVPTTMNPNQTTTASPPPTTTVTPTDAPTTQPPTTELPTTEPPTTILPTTDAPTTMPTTSTPTTTAAPSPHSRHFDAASFVGGIILALTLTGVAFAGLKFYRKRVMESRYANF